MGFKNEMMNGELFDVESIFIDLNIKPDYAV